MDDALITIVAEECGKAIGLQVALDLKERLQIAFTEARRSCISMPFDAQFRGAIAAVRNLADADEKKRIDAELNNIERVAKSMRLDDGQAIPVLLKPIGLVDLWKKSKP